MKTVFLVTCGSVDNSDGSKADPTLSSSGERTVSTLLGIPKKPTRVISGTGRRHHATAEATGHTPDQYNNLFGGPEVRTTFAGQEYVLLTSGQPVRPERFGSVADAAHCRRQFLFECPDKTVIYTDVDIAMSIGCNNATPASVYKLRIHEQEIVHIEEVAQVAFN
jgi:hypothetical protein